MKDKQISKIYKGFAEFQDEYFDNNKVHMDIEDSWSARDGG